MSQRAAGASHAPPDAAVHASPRRDTPDQAFAPVAHREQLTTYGQSCKPCPSRTPIRNRAA